MINRFTSYAAAAFFLFVAVGFSLTGAFTAHAQVAQTTMPALYSQSGVQVNSGNTTPLAAGYYYLSPVAQSTNQVYYYGNGTYYDSTTGMYGGSVADPDGMAGVTLPGTTGVPGVPNTGAGGDALSLWLTLLASGVVALLGVTYLVRRRQMITR